MINFYNQVPTIYSKASRDFQYLGWLINIVLNSVKHNVDSLYDLPNTKADARLSELLALTLGFKIKRNYDQKQLMALVSIIPSLLKYKGTQKAIIMAMSALIIASGVSEDYSEERLDDLCKKTGYLLEVTLPKELVDVNLFIDILPYILPAGMTFRVISSDQGQSALADEFEYQDKLYAKWYNDINWSETETDIIGLFDTTTGMPEFTNFTQDSTEHHPEALVLNAGLLDNTIIPTIDTKDTLHAAQKVEEK